jgi:hypothetical protein
MKNAGVYFLYIRGQGSQPPVHISPFHHERGQPRRQAARGESVTGCSSPSQVGIGERDSHHSWTVHEIMVTVALRQPPLLPVTATYQFMIDSVGAGSGTTADTLYSIPPDIVRTIEPDGPPVTVTIEASNPGQNAVLNFTGNANQRVAVVVSPSSPLGTVSLRRPDGSTQASASSGPAAAFMEPQQLAAAGTYTVRVDPLQATTETATLNMRCAPGSHGFSYNRRATS